LSNARILRIDLSPSRGLAAAIVTVHGGAAACAGVLVAGAAGVCLGLLIGCLGLAAAWDRALLRSPRSVRALRIEGKDYVTLELADAELVPVPIAPRRYVSRLGLVLYGAASMRRTIVVARDMLDPDSFRALRLWALWGQVPEAPPAPVTARAPG